MIDKLFEVERRYQELEQMLCDPDVLGDHHQYQRLAKERSDLEELVMAVRRQREINTQIEENTTLLDDADPDIQELARAELEELQPEREALEESITFLLLPKDPNDEKDVILEIRSGTGGEEAALFAGDLVRMYSRFAERQGWKVEVLSQSEAGAGGGQGVHLFDPGRRGLQHAPVRERRPPGPAGARDRVTGADSHLGGDGGDHARG